MFIQTLIADDEVLARRKLRQLLNDEPDIQIVGEGSSASEIIELVGATSPRLLFLDVQMPGMNGIELIHTMSDSGDVAIPQIIFTTAYDRYALQAFEIHAIDYLLKPFTAERLRSAVGRARDQLQVSQRSIERVRGSESESTPLHFQNCV